MVVGKEDEEELPLLALCISKVLEILKNENAFICYCYNT